MEKIREYVTSDVLKGMALIAMTLEHSGTILQNSLYPLTLIGRIAYPIFAYLIMYHLHQTKCFEKYISRLTFFGIFTSCLLMPLGFINYHIFFSFLIPILCLYFWQKIKQKNYTHSFQTTLLIINFSLCLLISIPLNYSFLGFLYMIAIYKFFDYKTPGMFIVCILAGMLLNPLNLDYAFISGITTLFLLILIPKNAPKRTLKYKWFYYLYYPLHIIFLKGISLF